MRLEFTPTGPTPDEVVASHQKMAEGVGKEILLIVPGGAVRGWLTAVELEDDVDFPRDQLDGSPLWGRKAL